MARSTVEVSVSKRWILVVKAWLRVMLVVAPFVGTDRAYDWGVKGSHWIIRRGMRMRMV